MANCLVANPSNLFAYLQLLNQATHQVNTPIYLINKYLNMKQLLLCISLIIVFKVYSQDEQVIINTPKKEEGTATKVFYGQKLINTKSVQVLSKGILEFNVAHSFDDVGGNRGGAKNFFGLDNSTDIRIGFQLGLSDKVNLVVARAKGYDVRQQYEMGLKWQLLKQMDNDPQHPVSLTVYVNDVVSAMKSSGVSGTQNDFKKLGDRHSQVVQLLLARKMGNVSLQFNPLYLHTNLVEPIDQENIFALGGAIRVPLSKKIILLADYFHPFRSSETKDAYELQGIKFYDPIGVGFEIVTEGHVFHLNFTNAYEILENRFIRRTDRNWGDWEFRWAFNLSRNFVVFKNKKNN